jgi:hypothetical protein
LTFFPSGISPAAQTFNGALCLKTFEHPADHIDPNAGTFAQYIRHTEITGKMVNGVMNHGR